MIDITSLFDSPPQNWSATDTNQDGTINGPDIPFEPGSVEAKKAWMRVEAEAHSSENVQKCRALGYEEGRGMYEGKPLRPGANMGDGDHQMLVDKLVYYNGYSPGIASKIAGKIRWSIG